MFFFKIIETHQIYLIIFVSYIIVLLSAKFNIIYENICIFRMYELSKLRFHILFPLCHHENQYGSVNY